MKTILLAGIILIGLVGCSKSTDEGIMHEHYTNSIDTCNDGISVDCFGLAVAYEDGRMGLKRDVKKARFFMRKACVGGYEQACSSEQSLWWKTIK